MTNGPFWPKVTPGGSKMSFWATNPGCFLGELGGVVIYSRPAQPKACDESILRTGLQQTLGQSPHEGCLPRAQLCPAMAESGFSLVTKKDPYLCLQRHILGPIKV